MLSSIITIYLSDFVLLTKERALVYSCGLEKIIEPLIDFSYIERIDF